MDIARLSVFTVLYGGRSLLSPSCFLMRWTRIDTQVATYCIAVNTGNEAGPILLEVTETGATVPDPFSGEVQLANGNYQLETWEQTSAVNLFPPDADPDFSELVNVKNADLPAPPPVDPCLGCGDECDDAIVELNGVEVATPASGTTVDIPVVDDNGDPVGSFVGGEWVVNTTGGCLMTVNVTVNGVAQAPILNVDPCVENNLTITVN